MKPSPFRRPGARTCLLVCLPVIVIPLLQAIQVDGTLVANGYSQDFDTLPTADFIWTNDSTLPGWYAAPSSGVLNPSAEANDGSSNLSDLTLNSVGTGSDRAISYHTRVNTTDTYVGLAFTNVSPAPLTGFRLACSIEQWKEGTNSRTVTVATEYRVGATESDLAASTGWTVLSGMTANSLNGSAGAVTPLDSGEVAVSVPVGQTLWIRWKWSNSATSSTASHDTMALDDVTVTLNGMATDTAPEIILQPDPQFVTVGGTATFSVEATGYPAPTYQWFHGEAPVAGAVEAVLTLTNVQLSQAGNYTCVATNPLGSDTSDPAALTVSETPLAPLITAGPVSRSAAGGSSVELTVAATGQEPFTYEWFHDGVRIDNSNTSSLQLTNLTAADNGDYTVTVANSFGSDSSDLAQLTVELPPLIIVNPQPQDVLGGGTATFSVEAVGAGPFSYQWFKGDDELAGETQASLVLTGATGADEASYRVTVSNAFGTTASVPVALTITTALPFSAFNLTGFGAATTGGGVIPESHPGYVKVSSPLEFVTALADKSGTVKVIEILNDLDLGYLEVDQAVRDFSIFRQHAAPKLHPRLIQTGVSRIDVQNKTGLTIFSANGSTIRHACINIKASNNIIIRNMKFDEMWEWDEDSKGDYDSNDWDFIDLGNAGTVWDIWIDHCTFTKAYDGICDIKGGSYNITFSWNNYVGDDAATNPNSFVRQQINEMERNPGSYPMYNFLRTKGFSVEDIVFIIQGPDKTHLIGANSLKDENKDHSVTFHHQWYQNAWDRLPRLRAGNVHNYNIFVDDALGRQAKRLRDERVAAMDPSDASKLSSSGSYNFNPFLNGSISTEDGAILVEKSIYLDCLTPLRNNQTDPSNPVYTGKILGLDCITRMTDNAGNSTTVRGNSTDPGNPMGPFQAPIKPFSWNLPGGVLPYSYTMDDPDNLPEILLAGAGAGRLTWPKENWLKTTYPAAPPQITSPLQDRSVGFAQPVTFTVGATGDAPLTYSWKKGSIPIPGVTGPSLSIPEAVPVDAGTYSVTISNASGQASSSATLSVTNPTPSALILYAFGEDPTTGEIQLPEIRFDGPDLSLLFFRKREDVNYLIDSSPDLITWSTLATNPGTVGEWTLIENFASDQPSRFFRLRLLLVAP